jgi:5-methyltetrahydrofolate--homocysteine methyltransferase
MDLCAVAEARTLLLDGAMGTQMMARGVPGGMAPELWNAERPDVVEAVHRDYFSAGSELVHTNTFGGTRPKLAAHGLGRRAAELSEAGARLAVALRDREFPGRLVIGDLGPTGAMLPPLGQADAAELRDAFAEQAEALVRGGVDLLHIETMFDLNEALAAVEAAVDASAGRPVCCSVTFTSVAAGYRTMMGVSPERAAAALLAAGVTLVGCNCSITAAEMGDLVAELSAASGRPVLAQPNAGQPRLADGVTVYDETPQHFADGVAAFPSRGAGLVGGCCGTTPAHIGALAALLATPRRGEPAKG